MRKYELMTIYPLEEDKYKAGLEALKADLANFGAEIEKEEPYGDRDLTYEVKRQKRGRFVLLTIKANPAKIVEMDAQFKFNTVKPYLTKGKQIAIQGSLRQNRWEKDGQKQSRVVIVADSVELLGGNGGSNGNGYSGGAGSDFNGGFQQRPSYSQPSMNQGSSGNMGGFDMNDSFGGDSSGFSEDIPF